ncbi:uncharacterized protein PpBr36_09181 [Pyricularia pennisetigena]|uniref:uncharacterized protein n=1 Tax=Pyricularia pennisetigena TaxID=1578925 RepID=UPI001153A663|nr:uncharacterized protein PpBr36_09181 [Pyricularia pennisetigena]TLS21705.1 hypothetical protein PpBr36_09181 [Pyricularia pennisetigena]
MGDQEDIEAPPDASQASSHFPIDPVSGQVLFCREAARRDLLGERGNILSGCRELDVEALSGGFERGCVVGVSSELEDFGLLLGLQVIARLLVGDALQSSLGKDRPRAVLITTLAMSALLPTLRAVLLDQAGSECQDEERARAVAAGCLEQIAISRVFDMDGLCEVLHEDLATREVPPSLEAAHDKSQPVDWAPVQGSRRDVMNEAESHEAHALPPPKPPRQVTEIMDSDDDALPVSDESSELSSPPSSSPVPPSTYSFGAEEAVVLHQAQQPDTAQEVGQGSAEELPQGPHTTEQAMQRPISRTADVVLVTHMSSLLAALLRTRDKPSAHSQLALLSSHLRHISRSLDYGCPLIMLLNVTNSPDREPEQNQRRADGNFSPEIPGVGGGGGGGSGENRNRPLDPTLRSIFNLTYNPNPNYPGAAEASPTAARRNKPAYGLLFTQLLDLHLLATLVPRAREDAEALFSGGDTGAVRYSWVIEVLLDELGVWTGRRGGAAGALGPRECREQRWAAVEVRGARIVDLFAMADEGTRELHLAGGFEGVLG